MWNTKKGYTESERMCVSGRLYLYAFEMFKNSIEDLETQIKLMVWIWSCIHPDQPPANFVCDSFMGVLCSRKEESCGSLLNLFINIYRYQPHTYSHVGAVPDRINTTIYIENELKNMHAKIGYLCLANFFPLFLCGNTLAVSFFIRTSFPSLFPADYRLFFFKVQIY